MELGTLQNLWYIVFIATMFAYAALDGFDIGVGCLHLFTRNDLDRRIFINAIGPVWDSNSLWVVISTGALLAGFPDSFATLFSGLYIPMMLLIFCYTYRAVAIEFRSKIYSPKWRSFWDIIFSLASFGLAFGLGLLLANLIRGLPIDQQGNFVKDLSALFSPYAILLGFFSIVLFMLHGALYLKIKTDAKLHERTNRWAWRLFWLFFVFWIAVNGFTLVYERQVVHLMQDHLSCSATALIGIVGLIALSYNLKRQNDGWAFLSSCVVIFSLVLLFALGTYPNIVRSNLNPAYSMTIYNSSSTALTLKILLGMSCAGVPLFLMYISYGYKVFKGKVEINTMSY